jgi:hypothetical protein
MQMLRVETKSLWHKSRRNLQVARDMVRHNLASWSGEQVSKRRLRSMNDPVTLGMVASLVMSKASEAALKGAVGDAAKDT